MGNHSDDEVPKDDYKIQYTVPDRGAVVASVVTVLVGIFIVAVVVIVCLAIAGII